MDLSSPSAAKYLKGGDVLWSLREVWYFMLRALGDPLCPFPPIPPRHAKISFPIRKAITNRKLSNPLAAKDIYEAVCKVSAPAGEAGRKRRNASGAPYWWGIVGVVRPKSLMPTTPHGPQRLESFMLGVPSRQRSNLLCVGGKGVGPAAGITLA